MAVVGATALAIVRARIEAGYDAYGVLHRLLERWHRVDRAGLPGGGHVVETPPLKLDNDLDDQRIAGIINLEQVALPFARAEIDLYFANPGRGAAVPTGQQLDRAVRSAASTCLAYGDEVVIWASLDDELSVARSGAVSAIQPEPTLDARWHGHRVIFTNFLPSGALWVAGQDAGTLTFYPDESQRLISVSVRQRRDERFLEASMRCDVLRRDARALHRIALDR